MTQALFDAVPALARTLPLVSLGTWPTPLERVTLGAHEVWIKREDLSDRRAEGYAGNKIRPLELVLGAARAAGRREIWATGAYGSNHALASVVHAPRAGLESGVILWPQPWSRTAAANLEATVTLTDHARFVSSVATMPLAGLRALWTRSAWVMPPGAATPLGALGHASAALELAAQLDGEGAAVVVLPTGSTCTAVGLLVGTALAYELGASRRRPRVIGVRVTPWPVTDRRRIARLAVATARELQARGGPLIRESYQGFLGRLTVVGDELGRGYGVPTVSGWRAIAELAHRGVRLDTTYSAKAAAWLVRKLDQLALAGPVVFWMTKSALPLQAADAARIEALPRVVRRWLEQGRPIANAPAVG